MARRLFIFIAIALATTDLCAASARGVSSASRTGKTNAAIQTANPTSSYTYNYMYPYLNNQMRTTLRPENPTSPATSPINAVVRTEQLSAPRRVVPRSATKNNTNASAPRRVVPRSAVRTTNNTYRPTTTDNHKNSVVDNYLRADYQSEYSTLNGYRPTDFRNDGSNRDNALSNGEMRGKLSQDQRTAAILSNYPEQKVVSSARCMADYTECMNRYCVRENTTYNRCYCSAKLSQIDATYQPAIESLINQIIALKNGSSAWSDAEMDEYWAEKIGKYTGDNSWKKIDDFLDIDWASMESRVRGQNAFITGHEYCVQHLQGCFYMASNLRDAYRSKINTDCATYEKSLQRLKNAAESIIGAYKE